MRHTPEFEDPDDNRITSLRLAGEAPWWTTDRTVPYGHVLYAAGRTGWSADAVVARLTALGFADIALPEGPLPERVTPDDALLSNAGGRTDYDLRWIDAGAPVPTELGYRLPEEVTYPEIRGSGAVSRAATAPVGR
ncbi:hypothetical protein AB0P17_34490 [Streptomyces sp. NPDC088124]|uniref:wHTH domain-containing protein n=1 Tax=Streptomyces sp. NPDC088124 TaxID=3154654 RepID=UPI003413EA89